MAFAASSKMVNVEAAGPGTAGAKSSLSLHFFLGASCAPQVVEADLNSCGLAAVNDTIGFAKVIGGPLLAELLSVNVKALVWPTSTLPKFLCAGLIFSSPGTGVGVGVGVNVGVEVAVVVAVAVAVAVTVGVAVEVGVAVAVAVVVAVEVAVLLGVADPVDVAVAVGVAVAVEVAVDVAVPVAVGVAVRDEVDVAVAVAVGVDVAVAVGVPVAVAVGVGVAGEVTSMVFDSDAPSSTSRMVRLMSAPLGGVEIPLSTVRSKMTGVAPSAGTEKGLEQSFVPAVSPPSSVNAGTTKHHWLVWAALVRLVTVHVNAAAFPGPTGLDIGISV